MTAEGSAAAETRSETRSETQSETLAELRTILARITSREQATAAAPETSLFGDGIGLDSLTGTLLLVEIQHRFGVDVAAEDLNLDALASLATLAAFVAARRG
jgi:acyl carrier protein